jgi:hypothetical protein
MGETCTAGQTCQTNCPTGANPMNTFCSCVTLPNGDLQYACVRQECVRDAGSPPDGAQFVLCPNSVRQGDVDCDTDTDTVCQTACNNNQRVTCVCVDLPGGGNNPVWTCSDTTMTCQ